MFGSHIVLFFFSVCYSQKEPPSITDTPAPLPPAAEEPLETTHKNRTPTPTWNTVIPMDILREHSQAECSAGLTIGNGFRLTDTSPKLPESTDLGIQLKVRSKTSKKRKRKSSTSYQTCPTCSKVGNIFFNLSTFMYQLFKFYRK